MKKWHARKTIGWLKLEFYNTEKTSMMWPSQNFLLYNGTVIKIKVSEWINI